MFTKVLIANRGEIACRIIRTLRKLGIQSVAVYSNADAGALHMRLSDEAFCLGPANSYLDSDAVLNAARESGAQAIHPGYGFLSENADFGEQCTKNNIVFIGPPAAAIRAMGSKSAAKILMGQANVPLVPGYHGESQDADFLRLEADKIGYPVLIKASAGGGGKGMRIVERMADFKDALASCQREAQQSFSNAKVLLEKYITQPRHIEMQIFADRHGNCVHIFERDCSVQRRYQKVLEEAPAPGFTPDMRKKMGRAACDAAQAVGYQGAGTVEFIVDPKGTFHFMEMNTRLQVEHPVTEMLTGIDLVEWQLRVADGEPLPLNQTQIKADGHALEARIYAEDPDNGFLPAAGSLTFMHTPPQTENLRIDSGVEQGDTISPFYDPMIAKLIVHQPTRAAALRAMHAALHQFQIAGVSTNINFLIRLIGTKAFVEADLDTGLIEREHVALFPAATPISEIAVLAATMHQLLTDAEQKTDASPWATQDGWRIGTHACRQFRWKDHDKEVQVLARALANRGWELRLGADIFNVSGQIKSDSTLRLSINQASQTLRVVAIKSKRVIFHDAATRIIELLPNLDWASADGREGGSLNAPMPGKIVAHLVTLGTHVEQGTPLLIMEAMKMEHMLKAPTNGTVEAYFYEVGDQVNEGVELVQFGADAGGK